MLSLSKICVSVIILSVFGACFFALGAFADNGEVSEPSGFIDRLVSLGRTVGDSVFADSTEAGDEVYAGEGLTEDSSGLKGTALPDSKFSVAECRDLMRFVEQNIAETRSVVFNQRKLVADMSNLVADMPNVVNDFQHASLNDILACGIKTGDISLWMFPYYIRYFLEFLIGLAGLAAIFGIVYGGFKYMFAGLSEDKDAGKKALLYSVIGFVLAMLAFVIVNVVIALVSG